MNNVLLNKEKMEILIQKLSLDELIDMFKDDSENLEQMKKMNLSFDSHDTNWCDEKIINFILKAHLKTDSNIINNLLFEDNIYNIDCFNDDDVIDFFIFCCYFGNINIKNIDSFIAICQKIIPYYCDLVRDSNHHEFAYDEFDRLFKYLFIDKNHDIFMTLLKNGVSFNYCEASIEKSMIRNMIKKNKDFLNYSPQTRDLLIGLEFNDLKEDPHLYINSHHYFEGFSNKSKGQFLYWLKNNYSMTEVRTFLFNEITVIYDPISIKSAFPDIYHDIKKLIDVYQLLNPEANNNDIHLFLKSQKDINNLELSEINLS